MKSINTCKNKLSKRFRNGAFTLAEVLITLGILGVVVAMTLPQVITSYKKKVTIERVKTTYSILSQAIEHSKNVNGEIENWNTALSSIEFAKLYILPYIKAEKMGILDPRPRLYTLSNQGTTASDDYLYWPRDQKTTPIYLMENGTFLAYVYMYDSMWLVVDINGIQGPNVMGIDGFSFNIDPKTNQLIPTGFGQTREHLTAKKYYEWACVRDSSWQYYRGGSCAALLMLDGWEMKEDYPWGNGGRTKPRK